MSARCLLVYGVLLLFASAAYCEDVYYHTKDKKTLVWINHFKVGDEATWSGDRDEDGYATGAGTLTWYKVDLAVITGSNLPIRKEHVAGRYSGKMAKGKLQGPVSVNVNEKVFHAKFAKGIKVSDWVAGPVPTHKEPNKPVREEVVAEKATPPPEQEPSPPIYQPAAREASTTDNDSLRSLTMPPSSLQSHATGNSPSASVQSSPSTPHADSGSNEDDVKTVAELDKQYQAAVKANDAETMDRILASDFVLVTGKGRTSTKADLIKEARDKEVTYEHQEEEEGTQKVHVWGDTAVVTARLWIKGSDHGKPIDYKLWFSDTYRRTPDGWRYVFGQASLPAPGKKVK